MAQGQVFLKGAGGGTGTFSIYFFQGLSFLYLEITLPLPKLCYMHLKKNYFFLPPQFYEKRSL